MKASIILATKDRGQLIEETISSLLIQDFPPNEYEILIVDNASDYENTKLLLNYPKNIPNKIRYVRENKIGLSNARNCGINNSKGDILFFIDDDAIAPVYWIRNIINAFYNEPRVYVVGGKVISRFTTPPPEWLDERLKVYISDFDCGKEIKTLFYNEYPRGCNIAFRRDAFEQCGKFLDCFGRKGKSLMSYEEIEMCYRIDKANYKILYIPDAEVYHLIRGDRLNMDWFMERFYWQGKSEGLFETIHYGRKHILSMLCQHFKSSIINTDCYNRLFHQGFIVAVFSNFLKTKYY
jgi:glucosyl-dolichyl phosphate glucuronosyltransferase